jgi:hypothetical protein
MTKIGIISDTHVGNNDEGVIEKVGEHFEGADLILHAGDITQKSVLEELSTIAPVIAVKGNADTMNLNSTELVMVNNFKIALNHGVDLSDDFDKLSLFGRAHGVDIVVTGHTHKSHFQLRDNMCFINPGSLNRPIDCEASIAILNINEKDKLITDIDINFIEF